MTNLDSNKGKEKKSKVEGKFIKRTISIARESKLNKEIESLLDRCHSILGRRKVVFADLVKLSIPKIEEVELESLCDKYRSAQDQLSESINALIEESGGSLSKDQILSHLSKQNLKKLCKDIMK